MLSKAPGSRGTRLGRGGGKNTVKSLLCDGHLVAGGLWQSGYMVWQILWPSDIVRAKSCPSLHLMGTHLRRQVCLHLQAQPGVFLCHTLSLRLVSPVLLGSTAA